MAEDQIPFWRSKSLNDMTRTEWESLCDGCGRCCLHKLQDEKTGTVYYTYVSCRYLDLGSCNCTIYHDPFVNSTNCREIRPETVKQLNWLPETCAYRLLSQKKDLKWWHPLVSGDPNTVHSAGISVRAFAVCEDHVHETDIEKFIIP